MRVLFQIRQDYLRNFAGDSIVMLNMKKHLQNLGVHIDLCTDTRINLSVYDVIHVFNTIRVNETYEFMKHAKMNNKKIVLTPMFWDHSRYFMDTDQQGKYNSWMKNEKKRKFVFDSCDLYFPHCEMEKHLIEEKYAIEAKSCIVPFGADLAYATGEEKYLFSKYGISDYILCVARIHPHKNQLNLLKALGQESIPIVLVGPINDKGYYKECMKTGKEKLIILDPLSTEQLRSVYKSARVHVLPSWGECPGLVSLEAGLAGCNVVTTEIGTAKDVFKEYARYCHPADYHSIYQAVMDAYVSEKNTEFSRFIAKHYTWELAAQKVLRAYEWILYP